MGARKLRLIVSLLVIGALALVLLGAGRQMIFVENKGNTPSIQTGAAFPDEADPGALFIRLDEGVIYSHQEDGTWVPMATINWNQLQGKPAAFAPEAHAATHGAGGADPLTPGAIGAETPTGAQAKVDAHAADTDLHHSRYTDEEAIAAILGADGAGSTLDADLLDGNEASHFATASALSAHTGNASAHHSRYTDGEAVAAIKGVDGSGSSLDADLLDGKDSSAFAAASHTHTAASISGVLSDYSRHSADVSVPASTAARLSASCPAGKKAVGGGVYPVYSEQYAWVVLGVLADKFEVMGSWPMSETKWEGIVYNGYADSAVNVRVYVICAKTN
ncbi:MAG: hypothetical protein ACOY93_08315 [Bacillota bacterium]